MSTSRGLFTAMITVLVVPVAYAGSAEPSSRPAPFSIPYVATRNDTVRDMLWLADVGEDDVVYDLGSGDGRIVIAAVRDFGARHAVGIEKDPELVLKSRQNAAQAGVADRVDFLEDDLFASDFREASVVTLFLGHRPNIKLRSRIFSTLKPGTRVVSHQFAMGEWGTDKALIVRTALLGMYGTAENPFDDNPRVPDYNRNESQFGDNRVSMWVVPAKVAGIWRGKVELETGLQDCEVVLHQRLSRVSGRFSISGPAPITGDVGVVVWGDHVRFWCRPSDVPYGQFELRFDGHVDGDVMRGTLGVRDHGQTREHAWEVRREPVNFTGTWEWPFADGSRPVRLRVEQQDGGFTATYLDRGAEIPVPDFYHHGGGFYFTLLISQTEQSILANDDTGWLIGEAIVEGGTLKGTVEFYPYQRSRGKSGERENARQAWAPVRIGE